MKHCQNLILSLDNEKYLTGEVKGMVTLARLSQASHSVKNAIGAQRVNDFMILFKKVDVLHTKTLQLCIH